MSSAGGRKPLVRRGGRERRGALHRTAITWVAAVLAFASPVRPAGGDGTAPVGTAGVVRYVTSAGEPIDAVLADEPINPASVVKVATTLIALEKLGPGHRFETTFAMSGSLDRATGILAGDLIVIGGDDPDFHVENAALVARELNRAGLREVRGRLLVDGRFSIGWEGGAQRRVRDPRSRSRVMAGRLRDALDPKRWSSNTRESMAAMRVRRGWGDEAAPVVSLRGTVGRRAGEDPSRPLVVHASNPLAAILKRFNAYSNNDIERLEPLLGAPATLVDELARRLEAAPRSVSLETLSGLGSNRMTARLVVRLLEELAEACRRHGLRVADVLPMAGCDPGTLDNFPALRGAVDGALVAKTGTLRSTDGGVAVLAGYLRAASGDLVFCTAAPRAGRDLSRARRGQEAFVLELLRRFGGARPGDCGAPVVFSDDQARLLPARVEPAAAVGGS